MSEQFMLACPMRRGVDASCAYTQGTAPTAAQRTHATCKRARTDRTRYTRAQDHARQCTFTCAHVDGNQTGNGQTLGIYETCRRESLTSASVFAWRRSMDTATASSRWPQHPAPRARRRYAVLLLLSQLLHMELAVGSPIAQANLDYYNSLFQYFKYPGYKCAERNELKTDGTGSDGTNQGLDSSKTFAECEALCNAYNGPEHHMTCVSFEYNSALGCSLSSTCDESMQHVVVATNPESSTGTVLYMKKTNNAMLLFNALNDNGCANRNELLDSSADMSMTFQDCAVACAEDSTCVSFEWAPENTNSPKCMRSTSCRVEYAQRSDYAKIFSLYTKKTPYETLYEHHVNQACAGRNELGKFNAITTAEECAQKCFEDPGTCISFELSAADGCQMSTSCTIDLAGDQSANVYELYTRLPLPPSPPPLPSPPPPPLPPPLPPPPIPPTAASFPCCSTARRNFLFKCWIKAGKINTFAPNDVCEHTC